MAGILESAVSNLFKDYYSPEQIEMACIDRQPLTRIFTKRAKMLAMKDYDSIGQKWVGYTIFGFLGALGAATSAGVAPVAASRIPDKRFDIYCPYLYAPIEVGYEVLDRSNRNKSAASFTDLLRLQLDSGISRAQNWIDKGLAVGGASAYKVATTTAGVTVVGSGKHTVALDDVTGLVGGVFDITDSGGTLLTNGAAIEVTADDSFSGAGTITFYTQNLGNIAGTGYDGSGCQIWLQNTETYGTTDLKPVHGIEGSLILTGNFLANSALPVTTYGFLATNGINVASPPSGSGITDTVVSTDAFDYAIQVLTKVATKDVPMPKDPSKPIYPNFWLGRYNILDKLGKDARGYRTFTPDAVVEDLGLRTQSYSGMPYVYDENFSSGVCIALNPRSLYFGKVKMGEFVGSDALESESTGAKLLRRSGTVKFEGLMAFALQAFHGQPRQCVKIYGFTF